MNARVVGRKAGGEGALRPQGIISGLRKGAGLVIGLKGRQRFSPGHPEASPYLSEGRAWSKAAGYRAPPGAASGLSEGWGEAGRAGLLGGLRGAPGVPSLRNLERGAAAQEYCAGADRGILGKGGGGGGRLGFARGRAEPPKRSGLSRGEPAKGAGGGAREAARRGEGQGRSGGGARAGSCWRAAPAPQLRRRGSLRRPPPPLLLPPPPPHPAAAPAMAAAGAGAAPAQLGAPGAAEARLPAAAAALAPAPVGRSRRRRLAGARQPCRLKTVLRCPRCLPCRRHRLEPGTRAGAGAGAATAAAASQAPPAPRAPPPSRACCSLCVTSCRGASRCRTTWTTRSCLSSPWVRLGAGARGVPGAPGEAGRVGRLGIPPVAPLRGQH